MSLVAAGASPTPDAHNARSLVTLPVLAGLAMTLLAATNPQVLSDADSLWHVKAGQWILEHRAVPHTDPFSFTRAGAPWTAHEWLAEIVLALLFRVGGWFALQAAAALAFGWTIAIILRFALDRLEPPRAALLAMVAGGMAASHLLARPHVLMWPIMALWCSGLFAAAERGSTPPWWVLPLATLWANLHGSAPLGVIIAGAAALEAIWCALPTDRVRVAIRWALFLSAALLAIVITPYGWHSIAFALDLTQMKGAITLIAEWQSANFHELQAFEWWLLALVGLLATGRVRLSPPRVLLLAVLLHFALQAQRHHATLGLVAPFLLARPLGAAWPASGTESPADRWLAWLTRRLSPLGHALAAGAASLMLWAIGTSGGARPQPGVSPVAAVAAAREAGLRGPVLNHYNFGGYLIFVDVPVHIDGRADLYGSRFMQATARAMRLEGTAVLDSILTRDRIRWTLLPPNTPAAAYLDQRPGWRRVFADSIAVVHARTTAP